MFLHNFKYSLKTLFKDKMLIFWTFAFPIILGTFFNMAFSDIVDKEKLDIIDIAIVNNEDFEKNEIFKKSFESLSDENNDDRLFNTQYVEIDKAKELLDNDEIIGYLELKNDEPKLVFQNNGINQTIFKYVTEEIIQRNDIIKNLSEQKITEEMKLGNYNVDTNKIVEEIIDLTQNTDVEFKNNANKNLNYMIIEFYTLIAMTCLYGGVLGMVAINQKLPNMSNKGKRVAVAPTKKGTIVLGSLLAGYIAQIIGVALLFAYTIFVLKVDFGEHTGLVVLLSLIGSFTGLSMGVAIGTISKKSESTKSGLLIGITMLGCFFAGMMGVSLKYIIDKNIPLLNQLNPANMITDGFYSLYYYSTFDRYWFNVFSLLILSGILIIISFLSLRRQKYDSI